MSNEPMTDARALDLLGRAANRAECHAGEARDELQQAHNYIAALLRDRGCDDECQLHREAHMRIDNILRDAAALHIAHEGGQKEAWENTIEGVARLRGEAVQGEQQAVAPDRYDAKLGVYDEASLRAAGRYWEALEYESSAREEWAEGEHERLTRMQIAVERAMEAHDHIIDADNHYVKRDAPAAPAPVAGDADVAVICKEASEVLEAVGVSGVNLPDNWRWPLADELAGIAALAQDRASQAGAAVPDGMLGRLEEAARRIENGHAPRRIPADPSDLDLVLAEVIAWLKGEAAPFWVPAAPTPDAALRTGGGE